jgi:hypothetical protein
MADTPNDWAMGSDIDKDLKNPQLDVIIAQLGEMTALLQELLRKVREVK